MKNFINNITQPPLQYARQLKADGHPLSFVALSMSYLWLFSVVSIATILTFVLLFAGILPKKL